MIASQFQERSVVYRFIKQHQRLYPIEKMCKVLGIGSRSNYTWQSSSKGRKNSKRKILEDKITAVYFDKKQRYGSPRITAELLNDGVRISRVTVAKYMKNMGLRSKIGKKFKVTTDSKHSHKIMENVLGRNFTPSEPSKIWVSDITYIHTREGFLYLTTVLDLYDRKCIGWSISAGMKTEETSLAALKMLCLGRVDHADDAIFRSKATLERRIFDEIICPNNICLFAYPFLSRMYRSSLPSNNWTEPFSDSAKYTSITFLHGNFTDIYIVL